MLAGVERTRQHGAGDDTGDVMAGQIAMGLINHFKNFYL